MVLNRDEASGGITASPSDVSPVGVLCGASSLPLNWTVSSFVCPLLLRVTPMCLGSCSVLTCPDEMLAVDCDALPPRMPPSIYSFENLMSPRRLFHRKKSVPKFGRVTAAVEYCRLDRDAVREIWRRHWPHTESNAAPKYLGYTMDMVKTAPQMV